LIVSDSRRTTLIAAAGTTTTSRTRKRGRRIEMTSEIPKRKLRVRLWMLRLSFAVPLAMGGTLLWRMDGPDSDIKTVGLLPARDREEIKCLVKQDIRTRQPGINWAGILSSPDKLRRLRADL
jgi:hypothetical protein